MQRDRSEGYCRILVRRDNRTITLIALSHAIRPFKPGIRLTGKVDSIGYLRTRPRLEAKGARRSLSSFQLILNLAKNPTDQGIAQETNLASYTIFLSG